MCLIVVPNVKEIDLWENSLFLAQSYFCKLVQGRECEENQETCISQTTKPIFFKLGM